MAFPRDWVSSFIAGKEFTSGSSRFSSLIGSFLLHMKLYRTAVTTMTISVVESFVQMDMERKGDTFPSPEHPLHSISFTNLGYIVSTFRVVLEGLPEVSSSMVAKDSHYHLETCLGCHHAQTARTSYWYQIFLSRAHCPVTVRQCFVFLDSGRKLLRHSLKKTPPISEQLCVFTFWA